jgi:hypothetical protein
MKDMHFETRLQSIAGGTEYPPTPDIAGEVVARLRISPPRSVKWSYFRLLIVVALLLASLLILPPVRAAVLEFIQVGVVRIFPTGPVSAPPPTQFPSTWEPVTATPAPAPTLPSLLPLLEEIAGETTLQDAQRITGYPILLPSYPVGMGEPDHVFVQDANGNMTILVWMDRQHPDRVKMSLHFIPAGSWAVNKFAPQTIAETRVNDGPAIWAVGPYPLLMQNGDMKIERLINGHVLIWEDAGVTYRLETDASMEEALRIAESLRPLP